MASIIYHNFLNYDSKNGKVVVHKDGKLLNIFDKLKQDWLRRAVVELE